MAWLTGLPFWDIAVQTESQTAMRMRCLADATEEPLIAEAVGRRAPGAG